MGNKITIVIEEKQLVEQKANNFSLYLAKKVNNSFTVIWQSKGAKATVGEPSYVIIKLDDIENILNHYDLTGKLAVQMPKLLDYKTNKYGYIYYERKEIKC